MAYGTINADQIGTSVANTSLGAGNASIMKNRIINGAMVIDQRNAGASITGNNLTFPVDRWKIETSQSSKMTAQQNAGSVTPPVGFTNYLGITSSSAYSVGSGDYFSVEQIIEGYNMADLGWGTANAKTVTLSFWVRSSLTGTFGGCFTNGAFTRSYPYTYTISSANTWEQKTVTIAGDTTGSWTTTNGQGLFVQWGLGVGSTYSGTAGSWASAGYISATGATSVVGTNGATWYLTGVQLEVGSSATGFEYRLYNQELSACQRYYQQITGGGGYVGTMQCYTASAFFGKAMDLPVTMRAIPTSTATGSWTTNNAAGNGVAFTTPTSFYNATQSIGFAATGASGLVAGNATGVNFGSANTITASAEL